MDFTAVKTTKQKTEKLTNTKTPFSILPLVMIVLLIAVIIFMGSKM